MRRVIAGMTMSLDGFVADPDRNFGMLYRDFDTYAASDIIATAIEETGAALMGRTTFDMADDPDGYAVDYEFQVPIVVVTHAPPDVHPKKNDRLTFTFVTDGIEPALALAGAAAGDKAVTVVGGAEINRELLRAGLVDELHVDIMPIFLGEGLRFFDDPTLPGAHRARADRRSANRRTRQSEVPRGAPLTVRARGLGTEYVSCSATS